MQINEITQIYNVFAVIKMLKESPNAYKEFTVNKFKIFQRENLHCTQYFKWKIKLLTSANANLGEKFSYRDLTPGHQYNERRFNE